MAATLSVLPDLKALTPEPDGGYPIGNTAEGDFALRFVNGQYGQYNTALGYTALENNLQGDHNTATGAGALNRNLGNENTATGANALFHNYQGEANSAFGYRALINNRSGNQNTAGGADALYENQSGSFNTATGARALLSNNDGGVNVANGYKALEANVGGFYNVASGAFALGTNISGGFNTASGANALYYNNGSNNTAIGHQALQNNRTGGSNVALGYQAGNNLTTGSNNIFIGANVLGAAGDANKIRIGKNGTQSATYIAGISGRTVASATSVAVFVDSTGKLGTIKSSARFKDEIKPMNKCSEAILKLEPMTFRYKQELDPAGVPQFGLIAEQVEKVDPNLVVRDEEGQITTVRYEAVNAMLLNEFLKEHRKVQELERTARKQTEQITRQQEQIEALAAGLQKVSDQDALGKPAARLAANQPSVIRALDRCAILRGVDNSVSLRQLARQAVREIPRSSIINSRVK